MKMMKAVCTATILVISLSVSAFAGDISLPGAPQADANVAGTVSADSTSASSTTAVVGSPTVDALGNILWTVISIL
jgi:hypothetical protein